MNTFDTFDLAKFLKATIELKPHTLKLVVTPREKITPELREAIKENRDQIVKDLLWQQASRYLARLTNDLSPKDSRRVFKAFENRSKNLELSSATLGMAGYPSSLESPEVVKTILSDSCAQARKVVIQIEEDRRLEETGRIQSTRQVFELARETL